MNFYLVNESVIKKQGWIKNPTRLSSRLGRQQVSPILYVYRIRHIRQQMVR